EVNGILRGPLVTSGIGTFRKGTFRSKQAAFAADIHNGGWGGGQGAADALRDAVDNGRICGRKLRSAMIGRLSRQFLLTFMCEMPAISSNRVTIDPRYVDQLGNHRPVIHFDIPDYCKGAVAYARDLSRKIFKMLGADDKTHYDKSDISYFEHQGEGYWIRAG